MKRADEQVWNVLCVLAPVATPRPKYLLHDDVRSGEEHGQRGDDGEHGEDEETDAIDHHRGEFPVGNQIVFILFLFQLGSDEAQLADDGLQVPLSLHRINDGIDADSAQV